MARNTEKYVYIELALLRDSPLWQALMADAAASGKPVAQVAAQRLADYYRTGGHPLPAQRHLVRPASQPPLSLPAPAVSVQEMPARLAPAGESVRIVAGESEPLEPAYQAEQAKANALAALEALDTWEPA